MEDSFSRSADRRLTQLSQTRSHLVAPASRRQ